MNEQQAMALVLSHYPNARARWNPTRGPGFGKGYYIENGPGVPGLSRTAGNAWKNAARHIRKAVGDG